MRAFGFLIITLLIVTSCKTSSVTTGDAAEPYREDLSGLRLPLTVKKEESKVDSSLFISNVKPTGHIRTELDSINQLIIAKNKTQRIVDGYTIQIYTGVDREAATAAQDKAMNMDAALEPVIEYHQPTYKVKIGQYTDRLKAHQVFEYVKKEFPLALLIPERISVDYD